MRKHKTVFVSLIVMALWGLLFPLVKLGYDVFEIKTVPDALLFAGVRFCVCGAIVCAFCALRDKEAFKTIKSSVVIPVLLSGFFSIVLHYSLNYCGLILTESSKSAILKQAGSIIFVCFSWAFFKEDKLTIRKIIGVLLGLFGIISINISSGGYSFHIGDILIVLSSVCMMVSNIISKKAVSSVSPIVLTGVSQLFGGIILVAAGLLSGGKMTPVLNIDSFVFVWIILTSVISYCLWYITVGRANLSNLYIIKFAEPLFACIFGAILLGEKIFKIQYLISFLLISAGVCISNKK